MNHRLPLKAVHSHQERCHTLQNPSELNFVERVDIAFYFRNLAED